MMELTLNCSIHTLITISVHDEILQEVTQEVILFIYFLLVSTKPCCRVCHICGPQSQHRDLGIYILIKCLYGRLYI